VAVCLADAAARVLDQVRWSCVFAIRCRFDTDSRASFWLGFCQNAAAAVTGQGPVALPAPALESARLGGLRRRRFQPRHAAHGPGLHKAWAQKAAAIDLAAGQPHEQGARADPAANRELTPLTSPIGQASGMARPA